MAQIDVYVTNEMLAWAEERVATGDFATTNDYFVDLIRRDRDREARLSDLRAALEDGRNSGVGTRTLKQIHDENRARRDAA